MLRAIKKSIVSTCRFTQVRAYSGYIGTPCLRPRFSCASARMPVCRAYRSGADCVEFRWSVSWRQGDLPPFLWAGYRIWPTYSLQGGRSGVDDCRASIGGQCGGMPDDRNHLDAGGGDPAGGGKHPAAGESDGKKKGGCQESKANHVSLPGGVGRPWCPEMNGNHQYTVPMPVSNSPDTRWIQFRGRMLRILYAALRVQPPRQSVPWAEFCCGDALAFTSPRTSRPAPNDA